MTEPDSRRRPLTKVGFRRDIRWFLTGLVGYLSILILGLLLLLQSVSQRRESAQIGEWQTIARRVFDELDAVSPNTSSPVLESKLVGLRSINGVPRIEVYTPTGRVVSSGRVSTESTQTFEQQTAMGRVAVFFDSSGLARERKTLRLTGAIIVVSTLAGTVLLLLYLPRITRPIEVLLDEAATLRQRGERESEESYLLETFRDTIATLRRQETELKLLHEREKVRADELELTSEILTRNLTSGFISLDPSGNVVNINESACSMLGLGSKRLGSIEAVVGLGSFSRSLSEALEDRASLIRHEIQDGGRTFGLTTVPIANEQDEFLGMLAIFTDLTDIRALEKRLREMQTLADLGEISAGIAHEVRNSLSTILGYLKLAKRQTSLDASNDKIAEAEKEASQLSAAVDGLLSFARPIEPDLEEIEIRGLVEETTEGLRLGAEGRELVVTGPEIVVTGDRALLRRAFANLIQNAIEATGAEAGEGRIEIRITAGRMTRVEIIDNGAGIDPDDAPLLFLPFRSHKTSGLGLGLSLARKIVLLHDGSIEISGAPGKGTTVTIDLPRRVENSP